MKKKNKGHMKPLEFLPSCPMFVNAQLWISLNELEDWLDALRRNKRNASFIQAAMRGSINACRKSCTKL